MTVRVSRGVAPLQSFGCGPWSGVSKTTRRLVTLAVVCGFAALAMASTAHATVGCNSPNLVPIKEEPPQWRNFAPAFCIHRTTQVVYTPYEIVAAHMKGFYSCFAWAQRPTSPYTFVLSWLSATNFCRSRAWYYVRVIT